MTRVPVLIVGAGMITQEVVFPTVWQEQRRGRVGTIRVASRRAASLKKLAELYPQAEFAAYPDPATTDLEASYPEAYKQAIADLEEGGVVIVATPDNLHTPVTLDALRAGHDVIVEKPLCLTVEDGHAIAREAQDRALYVLTDFHKRHDRAIRAARRRFRLGELGEMLHGHAWIEERREMPLKVFRRWCERSSPFEYIGVHYVDAYYFITGLKPKRVVGFGQKKLLPRHGIDAFDAIQATIEWEDGSVLFVQTSWVCSEHNSALTNQGLQLSGTEGEYWADHKDRNLHFVTQSRGFEHFNPNFFKEYDDWDNPGQVEYVGYGYDSIVQGIDDVRLLIDETQGLDEKEKRLRRRQIIDRLGKTRALPHQAIIATAVAEAVKLSIKKGNRFVEFEEDMTPKVG